MPVKLPISLGGSFQTAVGEVKKRMIIALDGLEKEGKTHFALSAPGPIAYQSWDIGLEGVVNKFLGKGKDIHVAEYGITVHQDDNQQTLMNKMLPEWTRFVKDYREVMIPGMQQGKIRTGVWDTGSEIWEALRLARVGKLTQVMPHNYTALNAEYQHLIREVFETQANMVILHKLKPEWKDNPSTGKGNKTGHYERAGYGGTGFLVQINARASRGPDGVFRITVKDCRQNPAIAGLELDGDMASFPWLGVYAYPDTQLSDWE